MNAHSVRTVSALAMAIVAAVGLSGCSESIGKAQDPGAASAPPITAAKALEQPVVETHEFSGRLEAVERVDIRARVGGYITAVNFAPGSEVRKGTVLFEIDPRPFLAERDRAEAAAGAARARAALARLELARAESLLADKAIARREFDALASSVKELEAGAREAGAALETARLNLAYTRVVAPISGLVSKAEITVGNLVDSSNVLTSLVSTDAIYASFNGDEDAYLRVGHLARRGAQVDVRIGLANESGFPHKGRLEFVDNRLDPGTGSVRMRASFSNLDGVLVPGLFARVQLGAGRDAQSKSVLINERAIGTDQDRKFVYVVGADGKAVYRQVTLGQTVDGMRVVRSGVKAGETIVLDGLQRVRPGEQVTAELVAMDGLRQPAAAKLAAAAGQNKDQ